MECYAKIREKIKDESLWPHFYVFLIKLLKIYRIKNNRHDNNDQTINENNIEVIVVDKIKKGVKVKKYNVFNN